MHADTWRIECASCCFRCLHVRCYVTSSWYVWSGCFFLVSLDNVPPSRYVKTVWEGRANRATTRPFSELTRSIFRTSLWDIRSQRRRLCLALSKLALLCSRRSSPHAVYRVNACSLSGFAIGGWYFSLPRGLLHLPLPSRYELEANSQIYSRRREEGFNFTQIERRYDPDTDSLWSRLPSLGSFGERRRERWNS